MITRKLNNKQESYIKQRNLGHKDLDTSGGHHHSGQNYTLDDRSRYDYGNIGLNKTEIMATGGEYMLR